MSTAKLLNKVINEGLYKIAELSKNHTELLLKCALISDEISFGQIKEINRMLEKYNY